MKILAFDSSTKTATVALVDESGIIGEYTINFLRHSVILMPMIDELLKRTGLKINDITHIAVSEGPGSFTGLRIGAATAKGLSHALNVPLVGVSSLLSLAYNVSEFDGIICPVIDALRESVYTAIIKDKDFKNDPEVFIYSIKELADILLNYKEKILFVGDGALIYKEKLYSILGDKGCFSSEINNISRASSVGIIAMEKIKNNMVNNYKDFRPVYVKKSAAEARGGLGGVS
ncbi:MAG: tRNA (adenosine(37)-N6)-threonylcarbamoyltransferase complex dimerization subunit type 1 TsaB [Thermoanaerobacteraceae bacterium]